jgi:DNA primase
LKYINSPGGWTKDALFPYDYVNSLEAKVVAIVEGPRDALVTIRNGLPALAIMGTNNWSEKCINLIMGLGASKIVLLLDPDTPGELAMRRIYKDLSKKISVVPVMLPSKFVTDDKGRKKRVKLCDPADLSRRKLERVFERIGFPLPTISR